ncbi:MAG TPA: DUF2231 domain-containing protein, partial [Candidatus Caenarcaniphilales bacterium]|nr:DUF2231 domain-containing protein [Candidatus Caenarcaniphilales bacterium]
MESKAKAAGHAIHPMLIPFPLALLPAGLAFDGLYLWKRDDAFAVAAYWTIAASVVSGAVAGAFGLRDWLAIPPNTRAKRVGLWHGAGNVAILGLAAASTVLRHDRRRYRPTPLAIGSAAVAGAASAVTGWLGGELVERLGV